MDILTKLDNSIDYIILYLGFFGPFLACFLIIIESIIPILPLSVFITINFIVFGNILGFIISWIFTIVGCLLSFVFFRKGFRKWFEKGIRKQKNADKIMKKIEHLKFQHLVVLIAIPFTPAFLVNIGAGLSQMSFKKFIIAIAIGKLFMVYFWGYVGTSLIQSLKNPHALINVAVACLIAYIISIIVNKKLDLK